MKEIILSEKEFVRLRLLVDNLLSKTSWLGEMYRSLGPSKTELECMTSIQRELKEVYDLEYPT